MFTISLPQNEFERKVTQMKNNYFFLKKISAILQLSLSQFWPEFDYKLHEKFVIMIGNREVN